MVVRVRSEQTGEERIQSLTQKDLRALLSSVRFAIYGAEGVGNEAAVRHMTLALDALEEQLRGIEDKRSQKAEVLRLL